MRESEADVGRGKTKGEVQEAGALPVRLPYSGHASRQALEAYSRLALEDAQGAYEQVMERFPVH